MGRATNCLRVLVSRVGIIGGTLVRSSFGIQRPEDFRLFVCGARANARDSGAGQAVQTNHFARRSD